MKPLAITLGDPAGIGAEVVFKALRDLPPLPVRVYGSLELTRRALDLVSVELPFLAVERDERSDHEAVFIDVGGKATGEAVVGRVDAECGRIALASIETAVDDILQGRAGALVTAPISKEAILLAGSAFPGHTEMLASLTGRSLYGNDFAMYFESPSLRVVLLTVHVSLSEAIRSIDAESIAALARLTDRELLRLHGRRPRIAVAGLNPHAGEGGRFGSEEETIRRGIDIAKMEEIDISGPWPPDTVFLAARQGKHDVVMAMYHDQGLIPVKTLDFERSVNVTIGLPFTRCSVDHGTAFDIAGMGLADPAPMKFALEWAIAAMEKAER